MDTTFETTLDQTSNTIDTTADDTKLDETANETNGDDDNEDVDDGIEGSEIDANSDHNEAVKPDALPTVDNGSTPRAPAATTTSAAPAPAAAAAGAVATPPVKPELKSEDKNISRSGRVIKRTKYLLDEIEESPVVPPVKRKRPLESPATVQKRRKSDDGSGENGTTPRLWPNPFIFLHNRIHSFTRRTGTSSRFSSITRNREYAPKIRFGDKSESPIVIGRPSKMHRRARRIQNAECDGTHAEEKSEHR